MIDTNVSESAQDDVAEAKRVIEQLSGSSFKVFREERKLVIGKKKMLKTSQIRKFYTAVNNITEKLNIYCFKHPGSTELPKSQPNIQDEIKFLTVKLAYQIGRNEKNDEENLVKKFEEEAKLFERINKINNIEEYRAFARYVEALVAFHKFYGGSDN